MNSYSITESCIGCTLCAKVCPVGAINGVLKERHSVDPNLCVRCGACGRVCAKSAVLNEKGELCVRVPKTEWKKPRVDAETCAGCSVCVENCPKRCLEITRPRYRGDIRTVAALINSDDCLGCGICENVCPIGAITMS